VGRTSTGWPTQSRSARCVTVVWLLLAVLERAEGGCPAAFMGPDCNTPKYIPCFGKAFTGPLTLNREAKGELGSMKEILGIGGLNVNSEAEALRRLPPFGIGGRSRRDFKKKPFSTCAIVGSSPNINSQGKQWGPEIDSHEVILRLNNAPTKGFEKYVGSRTTHRYENDRYSGFREASSETLISRYCHPYASFQSTEDPDAFKYKCGRIDRGFPELLSNMLAKKVHPLNEAFDVWMSEEFRKHKADPSSGMRGIAIMLHACETLDLYGFRDTAGYRTWYWDKYPGYKGKPPKEAIEKHFPRMSTQRWHVKTWTEPPVLKSPPPQGGADSGSEQTVDQSPAPAPTPAPPLPVTNTTLAVEPDDLSEDISAVESPEEPLEEPSDETAAPEGLPGEPLDETAAPGARSEGDQGDSVQVIGRRLMRQEGQHDLSAAAKKVAQAAGRAGKHTAAREMASRAMTAAKGAHASVMLKRTQLDSPRSGVRINSRAALAQARASQPSKKQQKEAAKKKTDLSAHSGSEGSSKSKSSKTKTDAKLAMLKKADPSAHSGSMEDQCLLQWEKLGLIRFGRIKSTSPDQT